MSKYVPMEMVKEYHGKICEHSDVYFAKKGKTLYTGKICNPRTKPFSAEELARQAKFTQARAAVSTQRRSRTRRSICRCKGTCSHRSTRSSANE